MGTNTQLKFIVENYHHASPFPLEAGAQLPELNIAYSTYGSLNEKQDNVIWICHALTANAEAADWWNGLVGEGKLFDPAKNFIVCANILGSCYGTTGPMSINPVTGKRYGADFPLITIRDMVSAHQLLRAHLGINHIHLAIGGSMGGQQVLEWAYAEPYLFDKLVLLATNARHSPWGIAFNEAQRMAIEADPTIYHEGPEAGKKGLSAARAVAMLSYRHYQTYGATQLEEDEAKLDQFKASSYQQYQGLKLFNRFNVLSYLSLSRSMDSHHLGRGRGSIEEALSQIKTETLVIGIKSDILFPTEEQSFIATHIPRAKFVTIDSLYGHDGFLIENESITSHVQPFLENMTFYKERKKKFHLLKTANGYPLAIPGTESF